MRRWVEGGEGGKEGEGGEGGGGVEGRRWVSESVRVGENGASRWGGREG